MRRKSAEGCGVTGGLVSKVARGIQSRSEAPQNGLLRDDRKVGIYEAEKRKMGNAEAQQSFLWRLIVVGGHTRSIGKTQLVCDVIEAFPRTEWIAGKITQYGHGVCARNGENCDCAPTEHACALDWETGSDSGTDSSRFLAAGARRAFWLRTKQGHLAEGLPLLRRALQEVVEEKQEDAISERRKQRSANQEELVECSQQTRDMRLSEQGKLAERMQSSEPRTTSTECTAVIVESNSLMQFVKPSLYFAVIDPRKEDFKESAQLALDRAQALVLRGSLGAEDSPAQLWTRWPAQLTREKPSVLQREGEKLPKPLWELVHRMLEEPAGIRV